MKSKNWLSKSMLNVSGKVLGICLFVAALQAQVLNAQQNERFPHDTETLVRQKQYAWVQACPCLNRTKILVF